MTNEELDAIEGWVQKLCVDCGDVVSWPFDDHSRVRCNDCVYVACRALEAAMARAETDMRCVSNCLNCRTCRARAKDWLSTHASGRKR